MPIQNFKVLTTFSFEAGAAITEASRLEQAVGKVSSAADHLIGNFQRMGFLFAADLGLAGAGILGTLGKIIGQFNMIESQQIKLGGIVFANRGFLSGVTSANDALALSETLMRKVSEDAAKFGLNEKALAQFSSLSLGITAKEGIAPSRNVTFGRNILKAAPQLGINAQDAQGQITRGLMGGASMGDPAFRAVATETTVFKDFAKKIGGITKVSKEFNKLPTVERFNMLNSAFGQFTKSSELLAKQANTIPTLILRIKQGLFGLNGAFRPLGEILQGPVKEGLNLLLTFIKNELPPMIRNFASVLRQLIPNLNDAAISLQQLSRASADFSKAVTGSMLIGLVQMAAHFGILAKIFQRIGGGALMASLSAFFVRIGGLAGLFSRIGPVLLFVGRAALQFLKPLMILFTIFQLISRAIAIARIDDAKALPAIMNMFADSLARIQAVISIIFAPFAAAFDAIARFISPLFRMSFLLEKAGQLFGWFEKIFVSFFASVAGIGTSIGKIASDLRNFNFSGLTPSSISQTFDQGVNDFLTKVFTTAGDLPAVPEGGTTAQSVTNIGKVEIRNDFKEKFEPDRIAFALKDQLLKAAQNPTGARNRGFAVSGTGG